MREASERHKAAVEAAKFCIESYSKAFNKHPLSSLHELLLEVVRDRYLAEYPDEKNKIIFSNITENLADLLDSGNAIGLRDIAMHILIHDSGDMGILPEAESVILSFFGENEIAENIIFGNSRSGGFNVFDCDADSLLDTQLLCSDFTDCDQQVLLPEIKRGDVKKSEGRAGRGCPGLWKRPLEKANGSHDASSVRASKKKLLARSRREAMPIYSVLKKWKIIEISPADNDEMFLITKALKKVAAARKIARDKGRRLSVYSETKIIGALLPDHISLEEMLLNANFDADVVLNELSEKRYRAIDVAGYLYVRREIVH